jgi:hypothetical protein
MEHIQKESKQWPSRPRPIIAKRLNCDMARALEARQAELEAIWRRNMARRDEDAARYGEPRNPREFYRGRKS